MNHIYKVIWNKTLNVWQAVSECTANNGKANKASQGKGFLPKLAAGSLLVLTLPMASLTAFANNLPTGGQIQAGAGQINAVGQQMTINQASQNMVVDWQSFSIGKDASVNFIQPNAQAAALNRVLGDQVSNIRGALNANGQVFLVNPNGILFSPTARVDVGSLVASTLNISNQDFMSGNYRFEGSSGNAVINQGNIQTLNGGTVAFIAAKIINTGSISTPKGNTLMGAGNKVILDLGGPVKIEVEASELETYIEQGGAIKADGGTVYLTAKAANALTSSVINHTGITQAQTLASGEDGTIMLMGDMDSGLVQVAGTIDASAPVVGDGGFVETSAAKVKIDDVQVTTKAENGETGKWLIDPNDYTIAASGGDITGTQLGNNLTNTNVTIESVEGATSGNGDIFVNDEVTWTSGHTLTLNAIRNIEINKTIDASGGSGGKLVLEYGQGAVASGNNADYNINAPVNLQDGQNFSTKLGNDGAETTWTVITHDDLATAISTGGLGHNYVLGGDLDLSSITNWTPIGNLATKFTGNFDGLGHTISNLKIYNTSNFTGLFGITDGANIKNIGVLNIDVSGNSYVGGLVGYAETSTIKNAYSTGKVSGIDSNSENIGGLIGNSYESNIKNSYSTSEVNGPSMVGGLIGKNHKGTIENSYAIGEVVSVGTRVGGLVGENHKGTIENSYAIGEVVSVGTRVGGLVGENSGTIKGTIKNSYATGKVTGAAQVGGLVGAFYGANIENSYATGQVVATNTSNPMVGGLVGTNSNGEPITNSFYNTSTSGQTVGIGGNSASQTGVTGKTTEQMMDSSTYTGWDTGIWSFVDGSKVEGYSKGGMAYLSDVTREQDKVISSETYFEGGFGTADSAYTITNWTQLQNINHANILSKSYYFSLLNDLGSSTSDYINLASANANGGKGWKAIGNSIDKFKGTFDGTNKTISDLSINDNYKERLGLFGSIDSATIKNIGLVNANVAGENNVGALVGYAKDSTIENSYVSGGEVKSTSSNIGGLVGTADTSTIRNSYATAKVTGKNNTGGLVGKNSSGKVENSYSTGEVVAETGSISTIGGLVGDNYSGQIINSFYDKTINAGMSDETAYGKTTTQMQDKATFVDWNIAEDSTLPSIYLYPVLATDAAGVTSWKIAKVTTSIKYTLSDVINNYIYNGTSQLPTEWLSSAIFGNDYSGWTLGTEYKLIHNATDVTGFKNAGTYANISVEVLKTGFVVDSTSKNGKFVIAPRPITVAADSFNKSEYTTDPAFTFKTSCGSFSSNCGLLTGESLSGTLSREAGEVAGNYAIQQGSVNDPNYAITFEAGKLTIAAVDVTPTPTPTPEPIIPDPIIPEPVIPEPVIPEPVIPEPVIPEPVIPEPVIPEPVIPEPVIPEPVIPEPVIPEPVIPEPVIPEPVIPEPVIPEPVIPEPVIPEPIAPVVNPVEQIIAGIQQQPSNVFTPAPRSATTPNAATSSRLQQSGNLELVEMNEADVNAMANVGGSNSPLLPIFVLQGGINLGSLSDNEQ